MRAVEHPEVLIIGAGPVGMCAALLLARNQVRVMLIDAAPGRAEQSYACALHPRSLTVFQDAGLQENLIRSGRPVRNFAFYEGDSRRVEIDLSELSPESPLLVLPQSEFEGVLEQRLASLHIPVLWNHRLAQLRTTDDGAIAAIDRLGGTSMGYNVPRWETIVKDTIEWRPRHVIGADGHDSLVRQLMGIDFTARGPHELFVVYEFSTDSPLEEVRVVLNPRDSNVLWPLPNKRRRWSFQWTKTDEPGSFPPKERTSLWCEDRETAEQTREHLEKMIQTRAPWFTGKIERMDWAADVEFEHRLAARFGHGHVWLAGDAAHQTGPIGVQSMNAGFREAAALAGALTAIIRHGASADALGEYDRQFHHEWERLLGLTGGVSPSPEAVLKANPALLSCLPATGNDLSRWLHKLGWGWN